MAAEVPNATLEERVVYLEKLLRGEITYDTVDIRALPEKELRNSFEFNWRPEASQLIQPKSVDTEEIGILPSARVRKTAAQSIADNPAPFTVVTYAAVPTYDTGALWDPTNNRFVIRVSGIYAITAAVQFTATLNLVRTAAIIQWSNQGAAYVALDWSEQASGAGAADDGHTLATLMQLTAGDYVQVAAYQDSTGAAAADVKGDATHHHHNFAIHWVGTGGTA